MSALQKLVDRCNDMDITEQMQWIGGPVNLAIDARTELDALRADRDEYKAAYDSLLEQNYKLEMDVHHAQEDYTELDGLHEKLEQELAAAKQEAETRRENFDTMLRRLLEIERERDALKFLLEQAHAEKQEALAKLSREIGAKLEQAREALTFRYCPSCGRKNSDGHVENCVVSAAIAALREE